MTEHQQRIDYSQHMAAVATRLLGQPKRKEGDRKHIWRYGSKGGSLIVDVEKGVWDEKDPKATGIKGGGVLDLIAMRTGLINGAAAEWLRSEILGESLADGFDPLTFWRDGKPISNTLAARYLSDERKIDPKTVTPDIARFHPAHRSNGEAKTKSFPAIVFPAIDANGKLTGIQAVRLTEQGRKLQFVPKISGGQIKGAALRAPGDRSRGIVLVEGPEDMLAVWQASGREIWATTSVSLLGDAPLPAGCAVTICVDRGSEDSTRVQAEKLARRGHAVSLAMSPEDCKDANETLKKHGVAAVVAMLDNAEALEPIAEPETKADLLDLHAFKAADLDRIPPRPWLLGTTALRGAVTALSAPGGTSKSTLELERCIAIATGIPITGERVYERTRTWYLSAEDPRDEVNRRIKAICLRFNIDPSLLEGWLFIHDKSTGPIKVAERAETRITHPDTHKIAATVEHYGIGYVVLDPLVSFHALNENDNVEMDTVIRALSHMAEQTGCAVKIVAHARKGHLAGDTDTMRGASAIRDGCRIVETLTTMTDDEAKKLNIDDAERRWLVRLDDAKANFAAPVDQVTWFRRESIDLDNGDDTRPSDKVGVLRPFDMSRITQERQQQTLAEQEKANDAVAEMIAGTISGTEMALKDAASSLAAALGKSTSTVREKIAAAIPIAPGGRDVVVAGERIRLWIRRDGSGVTSPQIIVKQVIDE